MKVSDFIIEFIISKGVTDIFGYPGGVICHLIDSATKYDDKLKMHINYHEQASAFAVCGYAQETCNIGVAFTTSGPGATNLVTGIANAFFDSIPVIFITGQVDTYGLKGDIPVRQRGFQETDIVSITRSITKYSVRIDDPKLIRYEFEKAYQLATSGNPGPVVIDIPADVQRSEVDINSCPIFFPEENEEIDYDSIIRFLSLQIKSSNRPCLLIGNGIKQAGLKEEIRKLIDKLNIPAVFSLPAFDLLPYDHRLNYGFVGANGHRYANFVLGKSDLIISVGSRLDLKQVGHNREVFASQAKLVRIDIDKGNLVYKVRADEIDIFANLTTLIDNWYKEANISVSDEWVNVCSIIKKKLSGYDDESYTRLINSIGKIIPENSIITADVGQSELWVAQQVRIKEGQSVHMSTGLGTMGYSLPAAIGSYYGEGKTVFSFNGDGGIQMNIQELQYLSREQIPVKVIVINNHALGMIRGFQEANFNCNYSQTIEGKGYLAPNFKKIAEAYGLDYVLVKTDDDIKNLQLDSKKPAMIEVLIMGETILKPNFGRNGLVQDQYPYIERNFFDELMAL